MSYPRRLLAAAAAFAAVVAPAAAVVTAVVTIGATPAVAATCNGYVGLTFDDGPTGSTAALLNALRNNGARATMFNVGQKVQQLRQKGIEPATLEWARKITDGDLAVIDGTKAYNREAPKADVDKLKILRGHVNKGQFVTKFRKVFAKGEMGADLEFVRAKLGDADDDMEYVQILPTSPP